MRQVSPLIFSALTTVSWTDFHAHAGEPFLVRDVNPGVADSILDSVGAPSFIQDVFLCFLARARDGTTRLWRTDGTWSGTVDLGAVFPACVDSPAASQHCVADVQATVEFLGGRILALAHE